MYLRWLNIEEFFPVFDRWFLITTVHLWRGGQFNVPTSQRSLTCCKLSMFLGITKESSHSAKEPEPYSVNIAIVAGSVVAVDKTGWCLVGGIETVVGLDQEGWVLDGGMKVVPGMDKGGWLPVGWVKAEGCLDRIGWQTADEMTAVLWVPKIGWLMPDGMKVVLFMGWVVWLLED